MPTESLTLERTIAASPQTVFDAWLDPEVLARFMKPAPGAGVARVEVDARVGGSFLIVMKVGEQEIPHSGEYLAIDRYRRLAFTWVSDVAGRGSRVELLFEAVGTDATRLVLRHEGLPSESARTAHHGGWEHILGTLVLALGGVAT
jgi:uncharacterized protein YndB with AHSA1/START domain